MKIVFIHIAKAAGSSVNRFFMDQLGPGRCATHIESSTLWRQDSARLVNEMDFLSGHIILREFRQKIDLGTCFVFTFLRDPKEQVISHLTWIRRLAEPSEVDRLARHPPYIQNLAGKLTRLNFSKADHVAEFVKGLEAEELALLDNPQVRYLRGGKNWGRVKECDAHSALTRLCELNFYGFVEDMETGLRELARMLNLAAPIGLPMENVQDLKYGMSANNTHLMGALHELIRFDLALYEAALVRLSSQADHHVIPVECRDFDHLHGHLDHASGQVISGWARMDDNSKLLSLDVMVNGECRATVVADQMRPDLAEKFGLNCAFVCRLDPEKAPISGDLVSVVLTGTNIELNGSPMRCP